MAQDEALGMTAWTTEGSREMEVPDEEEWLAGVVRELTVEFNAVEAEVEVESAKDS